MQVHPSQMNSISIGMFTIESMSRQAKQIQKKNQSDPFENARGPQSLQELEERNNPRKRRMRFGLASLVIGTNFMAIFLAVAVRTKGAIFSLLMVASFALPLLVALVLFVIHVIETQTGKSVGAKKFSPKPKSKTTHPLD